MEPKRFTVCVKIGLQMSLEFEAIMSPEESSDGIGYVAIKDDMPCADRGVVRFNNNLSRIAVYYLGFKIFLDVVQQKTVGNCHHFKCVTDLSRVDVYICDSEKWKESGEELFFSL